MNTQNTQPARRAWHFGCIDCKPTLDGCGNLKFIRYCAAHDPFGPDADERSCDGGF